MGVFKPSVLTEKGANLSAKVVAGITKLQFTRIALGDSVPTGDLSNLTEISGIRQSSEVSSISTEDEHNIKTSASFSNKDLEQGYYIRIIGLYANDPDEGEILYCVSTADEGEITADWMPPFTNAGITSLSISMLIAVSNTKDVNFTISDTAYASASEVAQLQIQVKAMAETVENTVGGFTSLEQIGVNDAELKADNWKLNVNTIITNCPYDSNWVLRLSGVATNSNLFQSIIAYINNQFGAFLYNTKRCSLRIECITHGDYAHLIIDFIYDKDRYQCDCIAIKNSGYDITDFSILSKKVDKLDHLINSYNTLEALNLSEDDFYADKWSTNVRRMDSYSPNYTNWILTYGGIANTSKLLTSALNSINSIYTEGADSRTTNSYVSLKVERLCYTDYTTLSIECMVAGKVYKCYYNDLDGTYAVQPFVEESVYKPSGSYVGDGVVPRTIDIGGRGNSILISCMNGDYPKMLIACGAVSVGVNSTASASQNEVSVGGISFADGVLTISGSNAGNLNGITYYYQVL